MQAANLSKFVEFGICLHSAEPDFWEGLASVGPRQRTIKDRAAARLLSQKSLRYAKIRWQWQAFTNVLLYYQQNKRQIVSTYRPKNGRKKKKFITSERRRFFWRILTGDVTSGSEANDTSSDSPSDPIRGCSCRTPAIKPQQIAQNNQTPVLLFTALAPPLCLPISHAKNEAVPTYSKHCLQFA